jgi:hypothetical protein
MTSVDPFENGFCLTKPVCSRKNRNLSCDWDMAPSGNAGWGNCKDILAELDSLFRFSVYPESGSSKRVEHYSMLHHLAWRTADLSDSLTALSVILETKT